MKTFTAEEHNPTPEETEEVVTPPEAPKTEAPKTKAPKTEAPKTEAPKTTTPMD